MDKAEDESLKMDIAKTMIELSQVCQFRAPKAPSPPKPDLEEGEILDDDDDDDDEDEEVKKIDDKEKSPQKSSSSSSSSSSPDSSQSRSRSRSRSSSSSSSASSSSSTSESESRSRSKSRSRSISSRSSSISSDGTKEGSNDIAAKLIKERTKLLEARSRELELKLSRGRGRKFLSRTSEESRLKKPRSPSSHRKIRSSSRSPSRSRRRKIRSPSRSPSGSRHSRDRHRERKRPRFTSRSRSSRSPSPRSSRIARSPSPRSTRIARSPSPRSTRIVRSPSPRSTRIPRSPRTPRSPISPRVVGPVRSPRTPSPKGSHRSKSPPHGPTPRIHRDYRKCTEKDINRDHDWFYNYFVESLSMDPYQAEHQCLSSIVASGYPVDVLEDWLRSRGYSLQSVTDGNQSSEDECPNVKKIVTQVDRHLSSPKPIQPKCTIVKCDKQIRLPNGEVLPSGTIQKIVHPYPRFDLYSIGPSFNFH